MKYEKFVLINNTTNMNSNIMAPKHENKLESTKMTLMYMRKLITPAIDLIIYYQVSSRGDNTHIFDQNIF